MTALRDLLSVSPEQATPRQAAAIVLLILALLFGLAPAVAGGLAALGLEGMR